MTQRLTSFFAVSLALTLFPNLGAAGVDGPQRITGPLSVEVADEAQAPRAPVETPDPVLMGPPSPDAPLILPELEPTPDTAPGADLVVAEASGADEPVPAVASTPPQAGDQTASQSIPLPLSERLPLGQGPVGPDGASGATSSRSGKYGGIARTIGATLLVVCLIVVLRLVFVKLSGSAGGLRAQLGPAGKAPSGVLFVLGRFPVSRGMSLVLLQLDQRVLLLSQTSSGFHTLAELTDADEVASIIRKVRDESGESMSAKFTGMLKKFESDPGVLDDLEPAATAQPVRLRRPSDAHSTRSDDLVGGYYEPKPDRAVTTGEDELRNRINRMREYGA